MPDRCRCDGFCKMKEVVILVVPRIPWKAFSSSVLSAAIYRILANKVVTSISLVLLLTGVRHLHKLESSLFYNMHIHHLYFLVIGLAFFFI